MFVDTGLTSDREYRASVIFLTVTDTNPGGEQQTNYASATSPPASARRVYWHSDAGYCDTRTSH